MSVQQQIENFYNNLYLSYSQLLDEKIYKIESVILEWDNIILLSDLNENIKPYFKYLGKNTLQDKTEFFIQYSVNESIKNGEQQIKPVQYLNKSTSSIINIIQV